MPTRSVSVKQNEHRVINYLLNEDKCNVVSPIFKVDSSIQASDDENSMHFASPFNNKNSFELASQKQ